MIANRGKKIRDILLTKPLLEKRQLIFAKIRVFIGIVLFFSIFIAAIYYWNSLRWYYKLLLALLATALTPDISDFKFLKTSYEEYKREWKEFNKTANSEKGDRE